MSSANLGGRHVDEELIEYFPKNVNEDHVDDLQGYGITAESPLVKQATEVDLGRLKDFECYKAIDENDPFIKDAIRITTKWENTWKLDSVLGQWACKARFVDREFQMGCVQG